MYVSVLRFAPDRHPLVAPALSVRSESVNLLAKVYQGFSRPHQLASLRFSSLRQLSSIDTDLHSLSITNSRKHLVDSKSLRQEYSASRKYKSPSPKLENWDSVSCFIVSSIAAVSFYSLAGTGIFSVASHVTGSIIASDR